MKAWNNKTSSENSRKLDQFSTDGAQVVCLRGKGRRCDCQSGNSWSLIFATWNVCILSRTSKISKHFYSQGLLKSNSQNVKNHNSRATLTEFGRPWSRQAWPLGAPHGGPWRHGTVLLRLGHSLKKSLAGSGVLSSAVPQS